VSILCHTNVKFVFGYEVCVTRSELVQWIAGQSRYLDQPLVDEALRELLAYFGTCLKAGYRIEIRRFGVFTRRYRRPRKARNPKTGAILYTKGKYTLHFKPGKALKERVNEAYLQGEGARGKQDED
jgi:integration host factor subunit beta